MRARVEGGGGSLGAERTVGGGWACGDWDLLAQMRAWAFRNEG